jgi:hypothetical protein
LLVERDQKERRNNCVVREEIGDTLPSLAVAKA